MVFECGDNRVQCGAAAYRPSWRGSVLSFPMEVIGDRGIDRKLTLGGVFLCVGISTICCISVHLSPFRRKSSVALRFLGVPRLNDSSPYFPVLSKRCKDRRHSLLYYVLLYH